MERIYGRSHPGKTYGRTWVNARFFTGVEPGVSAVWLDGEEPAIRAAYEAGGVAVHAGLPDGPSADEGEVSPPPPKPKRTRKSKV